MSDLPRTLEDLTARLAALERRVDALERPSSAAIVPEPVARPAAVDGEELSLAHAGGAFSVLGKAMLGIAGAYLLRAVAESGSLPRLAIAAFAIVYALLWLVAAARVPAKEWFSSTVYAGTSALILAPMLWELTLSFKVLPARAAAAILCLFVIVATALGWKRTQAPLFWMANIAAAATALALSVATHLLVPFIATLLVMALISEFAAVRSHLLSVRPLAALAADAAIWALIFIYSGPASTRMDYPALGTAALLLPGCLLFLIYAASAALRTLLLAQKVTVFETGQAMIAFLLAASSVLYFAPHNGAIVLGAVCLLFSAACYAAAFLLLGKAAEGRNFHVFAAWAAGLFLAGSYLCLPQFWLSAVLGLAAIAATIFGTHLTLRFHGLVFLLAAAVASGLLNYIVHALAGTSPARLDAGVCIVSLCAFVCYAAGKHLPQENWKPQLLYLATAALAIFSLAALLVEDLLWLSALRIVPSAPYVAFIRTLIFCALALALAFAGPRWRRVELTRMAYATLGLVAAKLLLEDLRLGHLEFIAAAIFLFAITLIAVPRLAHKKKKV
ncbi:MAG: hypothetical protein ABSC77_05965 [Terracidiphilus sp.]|jgi:hypothetical protein